MPLFGDGERHKMEDEAARAQELAERLRELVAPVWLVWGAGNVSYDSVLEHAEASDDWPPAAMANMARRVEQLGLADATDVDAWCVEVRGVSEADLDAGTRHDPAVAGYEEARYDDGTPWTTASEEQFRPVLAWFLRRHAR